MAIVYIGRTYTAQVSARSVKQVVCEKCGCRYAYIMLRRAAARGHSPYMLDNQGASERAADRAQQQVEAALDAVDPVECPDCGWFNASMVKAAQAKNWPWSPWGPGIGVDPNQLYPQNRGHFPGMPTPIRLASGNRPGKPPKTLIPPVEEPDGCITILPERDRLPDACCVCLQPTTDRALMQFTKMSVPPLDYPICKRCGFKFNLIERSAMAVVFLLGIAITTAIFYPMFANSAEGRRDPSTPIILGGGLGVTLGAIVGAFLWLAIKRFMPYPVKLSSYDAPRNLYRLRFASPAFVELVQQSVGRTPLPRPTSTPAAR